MKKLTVIMLVMALGFASDISAVFTPSTSTIQYGEGTTFTLSVTNNGDIATTIQVSLTGDPTWIRVTPGSLYLYPGTTKNSIFYFSNTATPNSYIYRVELLDNGTMAWEGLLVVNVEGDGYTATETPSDDIKILNMHVPNEVNPGETIIVNLEVSENLIPSDVEIILLKEGNEIVTVSEPLDRIQKSFTVQVPESEEAGNYTIRAHLLGKGISNETSIEIVELSKVEIRSEITKKLLGREVVFIAKNIGNTLKEGYVTKQISFWDRPLLEASPNPEITKDGFTYTMNWGYTIAPGDERIVASYSVDYIPYSIIGVLLLIAVILILQKPEAVEVKKSFEHLAGADHSKIKVKLVVSNSSDEVVENVVVTDLIPGIAHLKKAYVVKPKAKKQKDGTMLTWDLGKLTSGEERLFSYELVLSFGIIGKLDLPKPSITWNQ